MHITVVTILVEIALFVAVKNDNSHTGTNNNSPILKKRTQGVTGGELPGYIIGQGVGFRV